MFLGVMLAWAGNAYALEDPGDDAPLRQSARGPFGLGIVLGEPSGLTAKLFFSRSSAFQLHVGYGFGPHGYGRLVVTGDYLFHFMGALPPIRRAGRLVPYVGIGGRLGIRDNEHGNALLGVRVPLGMSFFLNAPLEIFAEVAIGIGIIPETVGIVDGGLGARFYF